MDQAQQLALRNDILTMPVSDSMFSLHNTNAHSQHSFNTYIEERVPYLCNVNCLMKIDISVLKLPDEKERQELISVQKRKEQYCNEDNVYRTTQL